MGKEKGTDCCCQNYKEKGRNYSGRKEKAFTTDEGAVGGEKESQKEIDVVVIAPVSGWLQRLAKA
jgi:hypothetical protein